MRPWLGQIAATHMARVKRPLGQFVAGEKPRIGFLLLCGSRLDPAVEAAVVAAMPIGL